MKNKSSSLNFSILYEDDDILVVNKPHNLSCIPTRAHLEDNLGTLIKDYLNDPNFTLRIINRLDKDTAGIVVVGKTLKGYKSITITKKDYFALCEGTFNKKTFTINKPIQTQTDKDGRNIMKRIISPEGKPSVTHVEVLKNYEKHSLTKLNLETGRTHQIRVHLASENHPLIGDPIYNENCDNNSHAFLILKKMTVLLNNKSITFEIDYPKQWQSYL